jgi:rhamnulokinase
MTNGKRVFIRAMASPLFIAVDLGAGSGRVFLVGLAPREVLLEEVRRFHYSPAHSNGHLRWDLPLIFDQIKQGLREAANRAIHLGRPVHSIGVDSWGVDYGLIDEEGNLVEHPVCYRDPRTEGAIDEVFLRIDRAEVFERTGIQTLAINTLFQLHAHARKGIHSKAARLLLVPDLINFLLTGKAVAEYTNATTTGLVDVRTETWDLELVDHLNLPSHLLAEVVPAGTEIGPLRPALAGELGLDQVKVIAPATHDTGSAVAGVPLRDGWAYISSGTWSLVGVEKKSPLVNSEVERHNFTNEGGAFETFRFLKNVMGLWILESCRKEWGERGVDVDYDTLLSQDDNDQKGDREGEGVLVFPDDPRFFNPSSMLEALAEQIAENGQRMPADPRILTRVVLNSLALRYSSVLNTIELLTKEAVRGVQIIGGGSQNHYLNQATAWATGRQVVAGPVEATVIGNALVQAVAAGRFKTLAEARAHVAENMTFKSFDPGDASAWEAKRQRYSELESRYTN